MPRNDPEREKRMAEALRVNLRRRKAQARAQEPREQAIAEAAVSPPEEPSPR